MQEGRYSSLLRYQVHSILARHSIKQQVSSFLRRSFHTHCLNVLRSEVLEFQEATSEYIQGRYSLDLEPALNVPLLKLVLDHLQDFLLL